MCDRVCVETEVSVCLCVCRGVACNILFGEKNRGVGGRGVPQITQHVQRLLTYNTVNTGLSRRHPDVTDVRSAVQTLWGGHNKAAVVRASPACV